MSPPRPSAYLIRCVHQSSAEQRIFVDVLLLASYRGTILRAGDLDRGGGQNGLAARAQYPLANLMWNLIDHIHRRPTARLGHQSIAVTPALGFTASFCHVHVIWLCCERSGHTAPSMK